MIVEITTARQVRIDTHRNDLTQSDQARLLLLVEPHSRRSLRSGTHNVTPKRRSYLANLFSGIAAWKVEVEGSQGELHVLYRPVAIHRGNPMPQIPPTIIPLEPGKYYPVGDVNPFGKMKTDKIVANIEETPHPIDTPPILETQRPRRS